jgi:CheY-like chemotaxis protein
LHRAIVKKMRESQAKALSPAPTIFVVDDDPDLRASLRYLFELAGYHVVTAADGWRALRMLESGEVSPDLLLVDLQMPILDGRQLIAALRSMTRFASLPIGVYSSSIDEGEEGDEGGEGVTDASFVLRKPIPPDEILRAVSVNVLT